MIAAKRIPEPVAEIQFRPKTARFGRRLGDDRWNALHEFIESGDRNLRICDFARACPPGAQGSEDLFRRVHDFLAGGRAPEEDDDAENQPGKPRPGYLAAAVAVCAAGSALVALFGAFVSPDLFRLPDSQEQDEAGHGDQRRDDIGEPGAVIVGNKILWDGESYSRDGYCRPDFFHAFVTGIGPDQPEGHEHGEEREDASDLGAEGDLAISSNGGEGDDGSSERAVGDWRCVGDQRQARCLQRFETQADENGRGDGDGCAKSGCAFEECAEGKSDEEELQAAVLSYAGHALLQHLEAAGGAGHAVKKDDVENDPADGKQAVTCAVDSGDAGHFERHVKYASGDGESGDQSEKRGIVRLHPEDGESAEQYDHGQRGAKRRQPPVTERIVALRPGLRNRGASPGKNDDGESDQRHKDAGERSGSFRSWFCRCGFSGRACDSGHAAPRKASVWKSELPNR